MIQNKIKCQNIDHISKLNVHSKRRNWQIETEVMARLSNSSIENRSIGLHRVVRQLPTETDFVFRAKQKCWIALPVKREEEIHGNRGNIRVTTPKTMKNLSRAQSKCYQTCRV